MHKLLWRVILGLVLGLAVGATPGNPQTSPPDAGPPSSKATSAPVAAESPERIAKLEQQVAEAKTSGDNAWMLVSAALVLMMTGPGLALFYGGLVRKKTCSRP
jgi:Amt family ammonium transporter